VLLGSGGLKKWNFVFLVYATTGFAKSLRSQALQEIQKTTRRLWGKVGHDFSLAVVEFEERHTILDQPGKLRFGIFGNRGNTGNYRDALAISAAGPTLDINDVIAGIRRENLKYGFYVNAEQQIMKDIGVFARASWNDGQNEILSFTDIDRSVSGGFSIKGSYWGRETDTIGLGGAINGLSAAHRDFLAAGGLGLLIGDGRINYRTEKILEAYYAYSVNKSTTLTFDYQLIANPAYNADRGPVSIISWRVHAEF